MKIEKDKSLQAYNTFGIEVRTRYFAEYDTVEGLKELLLSETVQNNRLLHMGGGSNLLFLKDFDGVILHSAIRSLEILEENESSVLLRAGAGIDWDEFVAYCVEKEYYGLENLSLIPGEVGASAVQNIGAYGVEVKETIERVECVDVATAEKVVINGEDCRYSYRNSIFKEELKGKMVITHVLFRLSKIPAYTLGYAHLKKAVEEKGELSLDLVRETIIEIRKSKLPDPKELGNGGSFFMNPVISQAHFANLQAQYPAIPHYVVSDNEIKVPAAWLIEQSGLKGKRFGDVEIYHKQPLVLVNHGGASGREIADVAQMIQKEVKNRFEIDIYPEVNFIG